jgi:hypothetical protein
VAVTTTDTHDSGEARSIRAENRYKWVVLTNTTVGVLIAMIDSSIVLIAMPAMCRATPSSCSG